MTDTTNFVQNSQAITSDLNFQLKPSGVRSRSYRASILPTNKTTFSPTDTCIVYIPGGRRNTYLDCNQSYMRITIKNTDATNTNFFRLDNNAACVINRIDVFHGGNLLETIQSYNILATYIFDMQASESEKKGYANIYGFNVDTAISVAGAVGTLDSAAGDRSGCQIFGTSSRTFCLPIFSGVCGVLADKMLPIGLLSDDIRLEITFETNTLGVVSASATSIYNITDFQLELTIVELSDEGESMVRGSYSYPETPLYLHGASWRHYMSSLPTSAGGFSTLVPARFASLKQLAVLPRRTGDLATLAHYALSCRINPNFQYYWFRIGSAVVPSKAVTLQGTNTGAYGEAYIELLKAWHMCHNVNISSCLDTEYNVSDKATDLTASTVIANTTAAQTYRNGFVIAQELESFSNRNDVLLSGMNTLSSQIFFETNIDVAPAAVYSLNFFAYYDHILVLDRGILSVKI